MVSYTFLDNFSDFFFFACTFRFLWFWHSKNAEFEKKKPEMRPWGMFDFTILDKKSKITILSCKKTQKAKKEKKKDNLEIT